MAGAVEPPADYDFAGLRGVNWFLLAALFAEFSNDWRFGGAIATIRSPRIGHDFDLSISSGFNFGSAIGGSDKVLCCLERRAIQNFGSGFGEFRINQSNDDFGKAERRPLGSAIKDAVGHAFGAQELMALLAEHPGNGVDDIGLTAAIRARRCTLSHCH